ncbi:ubiquitin [Sporolactobacillus sp. CPB3-1]|uniref:Ubiquitin n=1 Tax=Sporolactobacillus mangiferae TaxID=2940498 RepID=A0ABT0M8Q7_9BACL|nr:EsaB/YukD family protein [Sporolactobacillus mangiferae]MCL1631246.1 ubiquitin [Sporolactobacillus mangiferae]
MYINITVDLSRYKRDSLDLRISNQQPVKQLIHTVWTIAGLEQPPREGCWVRVVNKELIIRGYDILGEKKISNGDKLLVL